MCVTLVGGMDRLKSEYISAARQAGHQLKCVSRNEANFQEKIGNPDTLVVFTNKISHEAKRKAMEAARSQGIPIHFLHSCGVSSLRACMRDLARIR